MNDSLTKWTIINEMNDYSKLVVYKFNVANVSSFTDPIATKSKNIVIKSENVRKSLRKWLMSTGHRFLF